MKSESVIQTEQNEVPQPSITIREIGHFLKHGIHFLRPYVRQQVQLGITVVIMIVYELALPLSLTFLIDQALIPQDSQKLVQISVVLICLYLLSSVAKIIQTYIRAFFSTEMFYDQYIMLFECLPRLPESYYDDQEPGRIISIFTNDLIAIYVALRDLVISGLSASVQLIVIMGTLFIMSWQMAVVVLLCIPFTIILPQMLMKRAAAADHRMKAYMDGIYAAIDDFVTTQSVVRAFGVSDQIVRKFTVEAIQRPGERRTKSDLSTIREMLSFAPFLGRMVTVASEVQQGLINTLVICIGAYFVMQGTITVGIFSTYVLFIPRVGSAMTTLTDFVNGLVSASISMRRVEELMDAAVPSNVATKPIQVETSSGDIRLDDVSFSYGGPTKAIQGIQLSLPLGKSAAIVGRSGSGKTTLLKLILRFYEPQSGKVLVSGEDLMTLDRQVLVSQFGVVLQSKGILNTTIYENIRVANPDATQEDIESAAKAAEIHDTIMGLPERYQTRVGENGQRLSDGQRQRIALARAIVRNPSVLILDEVTAALDPETEAHINATIKRLSTNRTVILVTHRLASAQFADQIIVLEDGAIFEKGTHHELLALRGGYHKMWKLQSGFEISNDGHHATVSGERLSAIPLFQDLDTQTLNLLANEFVSEHFDSGADLYKQGEIGERFFIIARGTVTVTARNSRNTSIRLADLQDGDYFGEVEMLNKGRRMTTVIAKTPTLLLTLHADKFEQVMQEMTSLRDVMTQMALGRSLTTVSSLGRRRRSNRQLERLIANLDVANSQLSLPDNEFIHLERTQLSS